MADDHVTQFATYHKNSVTNTNPDKMQAKVGEYSTEKYR